MRRERGERDRNGKMWEEESREEERKREAEASASTWSYRPEGEFKDSRY